MTVGQMALALLDKISGDFLYVTDEAIAKLYICAIKFSQIEVNGQKFSHIERHPLNFLTVYGTGLTRRVDLHFLSPIKTTKRSSTV